MHFSFEFIKTVIEHQDSPAPVDGVPLGGPEFLRGISKLQNYFQVEFYSRCKESLEHLGLKLPGGSSPTDQA